MTETNHKGRGLGVKHDYPAVSMRKPVTPKVRKRIIDATTLLVRGLPYGEVAQRLGVTESALRDNRESHKELWDMAYSEAKKNVKHILKSLARTPEVFEERGRLLQIVEERDEDRHVDLGDRASLSGFLESCYLASRIELSTTYTNQLRATVRRFNAFLGKDVLLSELTEIDVCGYLSALRQSGAAPRSVNGHRQMILTLWQSAYDYGLVEHPPRFGLVRRIREEHDPPEAWTAEEVNRLLTAAAAVRGDVDGIPAGQWWVSLLLSIYWTSSRISAMLAVETQHYDGLGILVRKQKNNRPQWHKFPASCREAIERTHPEERELLWPWPYHKRTLWTRFREMVESAGLPCPKTGRQLFHRLRRTTLTLCAAVDPAIAQRQAGHSDYATTLKHYIDPRLVHARSAADVLPEPVITR